MKANIRISPVSACWTTAESNPAASSFGRKALPSSRSARSLSVPEMTGSFQTVARRSGTRASLLHDNHRWAAKSIAGREGAFVGNRSMK
jgi:hypothetical protein